ncbi:hypothetical protein I4U23_022997 [Adineta vaga]|nr:hypothetical protein I4U23_022997 [Adineta vaga]
MIPNLDQLITLRVEPYHVNDNFDPQNQFQTLLNRTSRLDSLTFINWSSSSKERPPYQYSNKSIRQLHLQDVERSYDNEQCASLIHSPLANQCEVLSISITNRMNLLDLIQKMTNLRALNVICQDDTWEINKDNLTSSSTDELIQWLIEHLPSTCVITRHNHSIQNNQQISFRPIHVWIR